jgi:type II secretory pathway pseudopilin PulG
MNRAAANEKTITAFRESPLTQPSPRWREDKSGEQDDIIHGSPRFSSRVPHSPFRIGTPLIRNPKSAIRDPKGFTYIALLVAITIIGITLGSAAKSWQNIAQRDKEEELLFRGNQYRLAIQSYVNYQGRHQYPNSIEVLLKDERSPNGKRHLRQWYKDPMTGEDFELVRDMLHGNNITGVHSKSDKTPIKQAEFPPELQDFTGKTKYSEWQFVMGPTVTAPAGLGPRSTSLNPR